MRISRPSAISATSLTSPTTTGPLDAFHFPLHPLLSPPHPLLLFLAIVCMLAVALFINMQSPGID
jgi:hypothetical protein